MTAAGRSVARIPRHTRLGLAALGAVGTLAVALSLVTIWGSEPAGADSAGIVGYSGQQGTTCAQCHTGALAPLDLGLRLTSPEAANPGEVVELVVRFGLHEPNGPSGVPIGFNLSVAGGAGTLRAPGVDTQVIDGEATHSLVGVQNTLDPLGASSFVVEWTAPDEPGQYTIYVAGVAGDGDGLAGDSDRADALEAVIAVTNEPVCMGYQATVDLGAGDLPTAFGDVIVGTDGDDVIAAGGGADLVCGGAGNDTIWGQDGADVIDGGPGDDKLRGGTGPDEIFGGDGADDIGGGSSFDEIHGGPGNDSVVRGGTGDDFIDGGPGDDALVSGNGGMDEIYGGAGNDKLVGGPRSDALDGGDGNDLLKGLNGSDALGGGAGDDMLFGGKSPDFLVGGDGSDFCSGGTTGSDALESDTALDCEDVVSVP